jgi:hypothetical protein
VDNKIVKIKPGLGQQAQTDMLDVDLPTQRQGDRTVDPGTQPFGSRPDQEQADQQEKEQGYNPTFGAKQAQRTTLNVRLQRVWSKKWMTTCARKPIRWANPFSRYWLGGVSKDQ